MYGEITSFRRDIGVGIIRGENGRKYRFLRGAVLNAHEISAGRDVDFEPSGMMASEVIVLAGSPWSVFGGAFDNPARFESETHLAFRAAA